MRARRAQCGISEARYQLPPKPADCVGQWGHSVIVGPKDTASLLCVTDTTFGGQRTLGYGDAIKVGPYLCTSRQTGITCENTATKHGFQLAQDAFKVY